MRAIIYITLLLIHLFLAAFAHGQPNTNSGTAFPRPALTSLSTALLGTAFPRTAFPRTANLGAVPPDTIRPGKGHLMTEVLKPGLRQYLVYFQNPQKPDRLGFWYWLRDIKMETKDGQRCFSITQHWYGGDSLAYRQAWSLNRTTDFAPIYHSEMVRGKTKTYHWSEQGITGADTLTFETPNFNWNLDIETFEMLPLAAGKSFLINFYDAGLEPPKYILYTVTGSEELTTMSGEKVDCWRLFTKGESPRGAYSETYWISKKTHEFLKEEDSFSGIYRYKVKMPGTAPDLLPRWAGN